MRCSKCLGELRPASGAAVCPRCGEAGAVLMEDGTAAEFESGHPPSRRAGLVLAALTLGLVSLCAAAWWFRSDLLGRLPGPSGVAAEVTEEAPDWRLARRDEFDPSVRDGVIAVFGAGGEDRVLAFASLGSGELVTVLTAPGEAGDARAVRVVRIDGTSQLGSFSVPMPAGVTGASLAAGDVDGFYLALTGPAGTALQAYGDGAAPLWQRDVKLAAAPRTAASVIVSGDLVYLAGPSETAGRVSVAAFEAGGAQVWQRSFAAPDGARLFVSEMPDSGLFLALETAVTDSGAEVMALWLTGSGETARALAGHKVAGRLAGAAGQTDQAVLMIDGPEVTLEALAPGGEALWRAGVPSARLHDTLHLAELAPGRIALVSGFRLSDVQTDVSAAVFDPSGKPEPARTFRLPAFVALGDVSAEGAGGVILSGTAGEGSASDAFLLALALGDQDDLAGAEDPGAAAPPALAPPPAPRTAPAAAPSAPAEASGARPGPASVTVCRFVCLGGETAFPLSKSVDPAVALDPAQLQGLHSEACAAVMASPDPAALPECAP